jgi:hypothetical protein
MAAASWRTSQTSMIEIERAIIWMVFPPVKSLAPRRGHFGSNLKHGGCEKFLNAGIVYIAMDRFGFSIVIGIGDSDLFTVKGDMADIVDIDQGVID